jgi:hypothetical protein
MVTGGQKMELVCKSCGKRNTKIVPAEKLEELLSDSSLNCDRKDSKVKFVATANAVGAIDPKELIKILPALVEISKAFFDWLKNKDNSKSKKEDVSNERKILVCLDCGHWERI